MKRLNERTWLMALLCALLAAGLVWRRLGRIYREFRQDDARAMQAYREAVERDKSRGWMQVDTSLKAAEALLQELKTGESLEILDSNSEEDLEALSPSWRVRVLRLRAQVLAAQGKEDEAREAFRKALVVEGNE